jgi:hypothetical protein
MFVDLLSGSRIHIQCPQIAQSILFATEDNRRIVDIDAFELTKAEYTTTTM